jgi:hypothetical protein
MLAWLERLAGAVLVLGALLDVFLTVLYARAGSGLLSNWVARGTWLLFRAVARPLGRRGDTLLGLCGPAILVAYVIVWGLLLSVGSALLVHPGLGTGVRRSSGASATDFVTALDVGGSSLSIVRSSDYQAESAGYKLLFVLNSLLGASVLSLTLTYLMQVYAALHLRNSTALSLHLQSGQTGDAAELIARWGPGGEFSGGYTNVSAAANAVTTLMESHHLYPVLFYFRFREPYYSISRTTLLALDASSLLVSCLEDGRYRWIKESAGLDQLGRGCTALLRTLEGTFVPEEASAERAAPDSDLVEEWRRRYRRARQRLSAAGIALRPDEHAGEEQYLALRSEWDHDVRTLAPWMAYEMSEVDVATVQASGRAGGGHGASSRA